MSYNEPPPEERKGNILQMWMVSFAISIFCCAIFSAIIGFYLSGMGKTLGAIDGRLANIEARTLLGASTPSPPTSTLTVPTPSEMPSSNASPESAAPLVEAPSAAAPAPVPEAMPSSPASGGEPVNNTTIGGPEPIVPQPTPSTTP